MVCFYECQELRFGKDYVAYRRIYRTLAVVMIWVRIWRGCTVFLAHHGKLIYDLATKV